ncbi:hypothetical protein HRTV-2_gp40 [Halorubrum virus HRTV-2]|nr:hypothetical protein HRTV-2_gp40 [Halorubrum virus HRTV-2]
MIEQILSYLPEVIVVGNIEMLFVGAAAALGFPRLATRLLESRVGADLDGDGEVGVKESDESSEK